MKVNHSICGAVRTFYYFLSSGTHGMLEGIEYLDLNGQEPSAIEQTYAIFMNNLELNEEGNVRNLKHSEKRATDYIRSYCDASDEVNPAYEDWEVALH